MEIFSAQELTGPATRILLQRNLLKPMDMQAKHRAAAEAKTQAEFLRMLNAQEPLMEEWCCQSGSEKWGISRGKFVDNLARCLAARFRTDRLAGGIESETDGAENAGMPTPEELRKYVGALHLTDLALACACTEGIAEAWEHFIQTYRGYLRACAGSTLKRSASSPEAEELADCLFAELYGVSEGKRGSLLKYFHGRSTLKTWLRTVLAQRHVDRVRAGRRFEELGEENGAGRIADRAKTSVARRMVEGRGLAAVEDPHHERYLRLFTAALAAALKNLEAEDARRLRMYYAEEKKLAEIGRVLGEHESSVSRNLERTRRELRAAVEEILRRGTVQEEMGAGARSANGETGRGRTTQGLSEAEMALCFEYAAEDAPIDLDKLFSVRDELKDEGSGGEI